MLWLYFAVGDPEETSKRITNSSRTPGRWEGKPSQSRGRRHLGLWGSGGGCLSLMGRRKERREPKEGRKEERKKERKKGKKEERNKGRNRLTDIKNKLVITNGEKAVRRDKVG